MTGDVFIVFSKFLRVQVVIFFVLEKDMTRVSDLDTTHEQKLEQKLVSGITECSKIGTNTCFMITALPLVQILNLQLIPKVILIT